MVAVSVTHFFLQRSLTLPEIRLDCHSDSVLLDNVLLLPCVERRMVGVGGISIVQLLQCTNDFVEGLCEL